jgi:hypothetical protein
VVLKPSRKCCKGNKQALARQIVAPSFDAFRLR